MPMVGTRHSALHYDCRDVSRDRWRHLLVAMVRYIMMNILWNFDDERIFFPHDVIFIYRGFCCDNRFFDKHNETIVIVTIVYNVYIYLFVQNILQIELIDLNIFYIYTIFHYPFCCQFTFRFIVIILTKDCLFLSCLFWNKMNI